MLTKIDALTGQELMRLWGVESWEDPGAEYALFDGCCVFALVEQGGFVDMHMAMGKKARAKCRAAVCELFNVIGHREIRAPIIPSRKHVCNLALRMGFHFEYTPDISSIFMRRPANG